jgi:hypothetical protein
LSRSGNAADARLPPRPEGLTALRNAIIYAIYPHIHLPESRQQNVKLFLRRPLAVGMTTPATATSHGKAVLAHLPESRFNEILKIEGLVKSTKRSITNSGLYRADLEAVRKRGYSARLL